MKILFIGDIVGKEARKVVLGKITELKQNENIDFVIANVENSAHGNGITETIYQELLDGGIDAMTSGNHIWDKPEVLNIFERKNTVLIRPLNYPQNTIGSGFIQIEKNGQKLLIINLMGRAFIGEHLNDPYKEVDAVLDRFKDCKNILVDYHAEATSEKAIMSYYLDSRVSLLVGTHTHIQTADEQIMPKGTGFISDVGMVGPLYSSLGIKYEDVLQKDKTQLPVKFSLAEGPIVFGAIVAEFDQEGKCSNIKRIRDIIK